MQRCGALTHCTDWYNHVDRGSVGLSGAALADARAAGVTDAEMVEVVAHVALNVFTNYLNNVADTAVDFPEVPFAAAA